MNLWKEGPPVVSGPRLRGDERLCFELRRDGEEMQLSSPVLELAEKTGGTITVWFVE